MAGLCLSLICCRHIETSDTLSVIGYDVTRHTVASTGNVGQSHMARAPSPSILLLRTCYTRQAMVVWSGHYAEEEMRRCCRASCVTY